ncbi:MAG: DUF475 domain-containing protein [Proteobacteria bacterium]|nr:DUF475 domain-containing protein [Pseudomonadota bacterium]MBS0573924.1 DUF475 domain-containing protein [Pseudomonadota bacterium]
MTASLHYFRWAFLVTFLGLVLAALLGWAATDSLAGMFSFLMIGTVLAVLEISLSFDNAIVNANILRGMSALWQKRFLTWGILIAVFGMRIIFPLLIVVVAAHVSPIEAVRLAALDPDEYSHIIGSAHLSIAAFGGSFLMMVALNYFVDEAKEVDWIRSVECQLRRCANIRGLEVAFVLGTMMLFASLLPGVTRDDFLFASAGGLLTFLLVEAIGHVLDRRRMMLTAGAQAGLGAFLYLEVLDASFSFDGVIGAFALTHNLFLIAIGLGIGAMYVRSMTIMLVERKTLAQFRYLEHGAFYSILVLSVIMFAQTLWAIPEMVTGLIGAGLIGLALLSSIRHNRLETRA